MIYALSFIFCFFATPVFAYVPSTAAGQQNELPDAIEGVGIDEKLDIQLPSDLEFRNESGDLVKISSFYSLTKPVILSLVYYSCPSLCNLHLKGVFEVFGELGLVPGKDFEFLAVSIDEGEDSDLAQAKKESYMQAYLKDVPGANAGVHFLTGSKDNINKLADSVGFKFKWNERANEWAHASAAIISTPTGKTSRYMHGVYFEPNTFRLSVVEASQGKIGSFADNFALMCFRWDPETNKYGFYIMNILRGAAGLVLLLMLIWLIPFWLRSRDSLA